MIRSRLLVVAAIALCSTPHYCSAREAAKAANETTTLIKVASRPGGTGNTLAGLDVLKKEEFRRLHGKNIALLTNISAIDRDGNHILDLLAREPKIKLITLFSPEHGLYGNVDTKVSDFQDTATGLMVRSLYSDRKDPETKRFHPRQADLKGLDIVVIDMQDIGARYYTYISYMGMMMESCAQAGVEVMVLDRPNPIGGIYVDGPQQDPDLVGGITSYFPMPIAHGMTMGELARMFNAENKINCKLTVVEMENWKRDRFYDQTGLLWVNPSPNIQDLDAAIVYTGIAITEAVVSMGRGTTEPFHVFGSPIIENPAELVDAVTSAGLKGVHLEPVEFTPTGTLSKWHHGENKLCRGARIHITDRKTFRSYALGMAVIDYLYGKYGVVKDSKEPQYKIWPIRGAASSWVLARTMERKPLAETLTKVDEQVATFLPVRKKYLIYN